MPEIRAALGAFEPLYARVTAPEIGDLMQASLSGAIARLLAAVCIAGLAMPPVYSAAAPTAADARTGQNSSQSYLSDLEVLRRDFLAVDRSYNPAARAAADLLLQRLRGTASSLDSAHFELSVAELAALADNGHTTVYLPAWASRYNNVPVAFGIFSDGLFITNSSPEHRDLVGSKVLSVEGRGLDDLRRLFHRYRSGESGFRDEYLPLWIESPELLKASGVSASRKRLRMELVSNGQVRGVALTADSPGGVRDTSFGPASQLLALSRGRPDDSTPLYLRNPNALFQIERLSTDAYYLQFRSNRGPTIAPFAARALDTLIAARPRYIVLDERLNAGGDLNATRDLMQSLGPIIGPEGRLIILTSGRTFSAGIASVAYAKQSAGERTTIVGEPVADRLAFYAEGGPITLPYSKVVVQASSQRHDYTNGCPNADCHPPIHAHPLFVTSLAPDISVGLTYADFVAGRDPLLSAAMRLIPPPAATRP